MATARPPLAAVDEAVACSSPVARTATLPAPMTAPSSRARVVSLTVALTIAAPTPTAPTASANAVESASLLESACTVIAPVPFSVAVAST